MCGVTGYVDPREFAGEEAERRISAMAHEIVHRGPDGFGIWSEGPVALGHRRLAIIELSDAGAQPMKSACGRYVCAFNGEIYNHLDLRQELGDIGAAPAWRGLSDTETLLAAIARWGLDETLQKCLGMFAIALWDRTERSLSLARDRLGEKPMYWGWAGKALVFGSELKAIARHPEFDATLCEGAVAQYLRFAYIPAPRSIYRSIFKLEPGTVLHLAVPAPEGPPDQPLRPGERYGAISIRRYWSLADTAATGGSDAFMDETEAVDALEKVLARAVRRQMIADVPLGAFLSGGVDSSTIVALMQAQSPEAVRTFTVGFDQAGYDEAPHAAAVARHLGTRHSEIRLTAQDALAAIPDMPRIYDEPFADSSQIPTYLLCRAARTQAKVALSGDGADELFGGYNRYLWGPRVWQKLSRVPYPVRAALGASVGAMPNRLWRGMDWSSRRFGGPRLSQIGEILSTCLRQVRNADDLYLNIVSHWSRPGAVVIGGFGEPGTLLDDAFRDDVNAGCIGSGMMIQDLRSYLPDDILCKVDRAAMHVGLETRAPFLDPDVIEIASRLPSSMRFRANTGKWALRQVLDRYVPRELVDRPKMGFSVPVGEWMRGPLRDWAEDLLSVSALDGSGLLKPEPIRALWSDHVEGRCDWTKQLWAVLMLQAWQREAPAGAGAMGVSGVELVGGL